MRENGRVLAIWSLAVLVLMGLAFARNRNPKDYPQQVKVISFQRQPCLRQVGEITRVCHFVGFQLEGQTFTGSCFHCDPLLPGQTYPGRLDQKNLVLYVIHQKGSGSWGQDDYSITELGGQPQATTDSH